MIPIYHLDNKKIQKEFTSSNFCSFFSNMLNVLVFFPVVLISRKKKNLVTLSKISDCKLGNSRIPEPRISPKSKKLWIYMQNAKISEFLIPILDITEYIQEGNDQHIGRKLYSTQTPSSYTQLRERMLTPFHSFHDPFPIKLAGRTRVCL